VASDGKIVFANPAVCSLFGTHNHQVGNPLLFLIEDIGLYEKISACAGTDADFEYKLGEKELSVAIRHIKAEDRNSVSIIIILTDITKEKNIAREKSDFFANASHELKTPITVLLGLTELMLAKSTPDDSCRAQLERIHHESSRLSGLISDMLELSGLERKTMGESSKAEVDLRAVAEEVLSELSQKLAEKNVTATVNGNGIVTADAGQMYELVENLCSNAVNYNKVGGKITVTLTDSETDVTLEIEDTGIGIAKEHLPRLCERFYRVDKSHSKKTGGTGLGLAIVKHICILNGAALDIQSDLGIGTKVKVRFTRH
jgi:two-component system phosphate regulon sensor histidine kinase PhoR